MSFRILPVAALFRTIDSRLLLDDFLGCVLRWLLLDLQRRSSVANGVLGWICVDVGVRHVHTLLFRHEPNITGSGVVVELLSERPEYVVLESISCCVCRNVFPDVACFGIPEDRLSISTQSENTSATLIRSARLHIFLVLQWLCIGTFSTPNTDTVGIHSSAKCLPLVATFINHFLAFTLPWCAPVDKDSAFHSCVFLTTVPLLLIGMVGAATGITYNVRFVSWLAFSISMWMGFGCRGLWEESKRIRLIGCVAIVTCFGIFSLANYQRTNDARYLIEDTRSVVKYLRADQLRDRPVFVVSDYMVRPLSYYGQELRFLELPEIGNQGNEILSKDDLTTAIQSMESAATDEFWLVYSRSFHGDPSGLLLQYLEKRGMEKQRSFAGVELFFGNRASLLKD